MRVRLERTTLTTASGTRVVEVEPEYVVVESDSLATALLTFIADDSAQLLGSIRQEGDRAKATVWKNRVYLLSAEQAPD
jgi:hypothetical protein